MEKLKNSPWKTPAKLWIDKKLEKLTKKFSLEEKKEIVSMIDAIYTEGKNYIPKKWKFSAIENTILDVVSESNDKEKEKLSLFSFFLAFDTLPIVEKIKIKFFMTDLNYTQEDWKIYKDKILTIMNQKKYSIDALAERKNYHDIWVNLSMKIAKESQKLSPEDVSELQEFEKSDGQILSPLNKTYILRLLSQKNK